MCKPVCYSSTNQIIPCHINRSSCPVPIETATGIDWFWNYAIIILYDTVCTNNWLYTIMIEYKLCTEMILADLHSRVKVDCDTLWTELTTTRPIYPDLTSVPFKTIFIMIQSAPSLIEPFCNNMTFGPFCCKTWPLAHSAAKLDL